MTIEVGEYRYTQTTSGPDAIGVSWIYVTRREVLEIDGEAVTLSICEQAQFPSHSPPEVAAIEWSEIPNSGPLTTTAAIVSGQYLTAITLPDAFLFDDEAAAIEARNIHRQHVFVNRERGKPVPQLEAQQAFEFSVLDYRYPW